MHIAIYAILAFCCAIFFLTLITRWLNNDNSSEDEETKHTEYLKRIRRVNKREQILSSEIEQQYQQLVLMRTKLLQQQLHKANLLAAAEKQGIDVNTGETVSNISPAQLEVLSLQIQLKSLSDLPTTQQLVSDPIINPPQRKTLMEREEEKLKRKKERREKKAQKIKEEMEKGNVDNEQVNEEKLTRRKNKTEESRSSRRRHSDHHQRSHSQKRRENYLQVETPHHHQTTEQEAEFLPSPQSAPMTTTSISSKSPSSLTSSLTVQLPSYLSTTSYNSSSSSSSTQRSSRSRSHKKPSSNATKRPSSRYSLHSTHSQYTSSSSFLSSDDTDGFLPGRRSRSSSRRKVRKSRKKGKTDSRSNSVDSRLPSTLLSNNTAIIRETQSSDTTPFSPIDDIINGSLPPSRKKVLYQFPVLPLHIPATPQQLDNINKDIEKGAVIRMNSLLDGLISEGEQMSRIV